MTDDERRLRARKLRRLRLSRIDLVPRGANPLSSISFFKAEVPVVKRKPLAQQAAELTRRVAKMDRELSRRRRRAEPDSEGVSEDLEPQWHVELEAAANALVMKVAGTSEQLTKPQAKVAIFDVRPDLKAKAMADLHPVAKAEPHPAAEFLRKRREAAGISQATLAKRAGLASQQVVSALEHGTQPSFESFSKAAQALGVTYDQLVEAGFFRGGSS